ncbi:MAG: hydroxymethylbilane synthase [Bacteroidota bacterium]
MTADTLRIGTRGSELALWQARWTREALLRQHPSLNATIVIIKTTGDRVLDAPLSKIGDKGLFTREIENALLQNKIDLAVHSLKDLPTELPPGLLLGAITERDDPRDVFIPHPANTVRSIMEQPSGAIIATGSLRRSCQLRALRSDFQVVDIRGNLVTRLRKLEESDWSGMILARAGVVRLGWEAKIGEVIPATSILPAVGQGALGIEIRSGDQRVNAFVSPLTHDATEKAVLAERSLLRRLEGGCQVPIGTYARLVARRGSMKLLMDAMVGALDGSSVVRGQIEGDPAAAEDLGARLAEQLLHDGAGEILRSIRGAGGNVRIA